MLTNGVARGFQFKGYQLGFFRKMSSLGYAGSCAASVVPLKKTQKYPNYFFSAIINKMDVESPAQSITDFLCNTKSLRNMMYHSVRHAENNYLYDHFIFWLSSYVKKDASHLCDYIDDKINLKDFCMDFVKFCFMNNIYLDAENTLISFNRHNLISDKAVKSELLKIPRMDKINLFGFGLDDGKYEKRIARFLVAHGKASSVNLFGFDPYANEGFGIEYFSTSDLILNEAPKFDVIIARWSLHHVELKSRWLELIGCINRCNPEATILIVEHGFLKDRVSPINKKVSDIFNATFDIIANIGLRPGYFTSTSPDVGANFFIQYLDPQDFISIKNSVSVKLDQKIYDIGPEFPNQTICCMRRL